MDNAMAFLSSHSAAEAMFRNSTAQVAAMVLRGSRPWMVLYKMEVFSRSLMGIDFDPHFRFHPYYIRFSRQSCSSLCCALTFFFSNDAVYTDTDDSLNDFAR